MLRARSGLRNVIASYNCQSGLTDTVQLVDGNKDGSSNQMYFLKYKYYFKLTVAVTVSVLCSRYV